LRTSDFDYELPRELIAQYPAETRDESRLLVLRRSDGSIEHRTFRDIREYLEGGDVLVLNESEVVPARLLGAKEETGGRAEMFVLRRLPDDRWEVLIRPGGRVREGAVLTFGEGRLKARVGGSLPDGKREVELLARGDVEGALEELGRVPLPPYIDREPEEVDRERYQTVYARVKGAVAAPTAGLHFTEESLRAIEGRGVSIARLVLHVGLGTFRPVGVDDPAEHVMDEERYEVTEQAAARINDARRAGGRIVAVGTTCVRVLETVSDDSGVVAPGVGATRLFIRPPHRFRAVDVLVTNFHLPRSTLLMLVSAFAGREAVLEAYAEAIRKRYRFYSYGDAMLIA
jgi:S-adenosylmethionine:tRNA ribosyltransferase-isomerase